MIVLVISLRDGFPPIQQYPLLSAALFAFIAAIPMAVLAIGGRRWFMRLERRIQKLVARAAVTLLVAELLALVAGLK